MGPVLLGFAASNSYLAGGNSGEKVNVFAKLPNKSLAKINEFTVFNNVIREIIHG